MRLQIKGYLTVFLSLTITIILSLILALFQGARIGEVKMKTECVSDIAMNSVLAEYSRALYDQYGLLMVDTSYGTDNPSILNAQEHLRFYAQKNFEKSTLGKLSGAGDITSMYLREANITGSSFAMDKEGAVLNRQILKYMGAEPLEGMLLNVQENAGMIESGGLEDTDVEAMARANQEQIDSIELPTIINEDGEEEQITLGNPADSVNAQKAIGALPLAIPDRSEISQSVVNLSEYASHRKLNKGTGLNDQEDISVTERLLLEQYYFEKCSRFGGEKDKALLKYQLEYLIYGKNSDWGNLEKMAEYLLFIREASNMMYLFNCSSKVAEADAIASVLAAVTFVPELREPVKYSILFAWTFAESISDLNILFSGGRVPIFKSDSTWRLSLPQMFFFRSFLKGGDLGEGLYYSDYLRARLFMTDTKTKTERLADIIEMDIRRTNGNQYFKLDHCLDTFRGEILVGSSFGYDAKVERIYGYD